MTTDMLPLTEYRDLCKEIDIFDARIGQLLRERKYYWKMALPNSESSGIANYGTERVSSNFAMIPFDTAFKHIVALDDKIQTLQKIKNEKDLVKSQIEKKISEFDRLDYQVLYWRMKGLSLVKIADKLGYSVGYIQNISAKAMIGRSHEKMGKSVKKKLARKM